MKVLKQIIKDEVIEPWDHKNLNEQVEDFFNLNPTAENIAKLIYEVTADHGFPIIEASLWETPKCYATFHG